jgi:hypothetical protein
MEEWLHGVAPHVFARAPADIQRDVVVDEKDRPGAAAPRVRGVGRDAFDRVRVEIAAAHLDDGAEAAVERAAPRRFDHIDLAAEERVSAEHASAPIGQP